MKRNVQGRRQPGQRRIRTMAIFLPFFSYLIFISMGQNYQNIFEMTCFYLYVSVSHLKDILNLADKL